MVNPGIPWRARLWAELARSYPHRCLEEVGGGTGLDGSPAPSSAVAEPAEPASSMPPQPLPSPAARLVDIRRCLAPVRPIVSRTEDVRHPLNNWTAVVRLALLAIAAHVLYTDLTRYPPHNLRVYMFYLTHWGHCLNVSYLLCSFLLACGAAASHTELNDFDGMDGGGNGIRQLPRLLRFTWSLYATAAPLSIAVALLYWAAVAPASQAPGAVGYVTVMEHGGVGILVLADGVLVGSVPVRARQFVLLASVGLAYLAWTGVDYVLNLGNGEWGPAYDDDALYPVLSWSPEGRAEAAAASGAALLIVCPAAFWAIWMLGLASVERVSSGGDGKVEQGRGWCQGCCGRRVVWDGRHRPLQGDCAPARDEHGAVYCEMPPGTLA